jgi:hypothetical protein
VIVTKGRLQIARGSKTVLTNRAIRLIDAIRSRYSGTSVQLATPPVGAGVKAAG